jgi:glycosyltransferase involved in cell wall biosynthesis
MASLVAGLGRLIRKRVFVSDLGGRGWDISGYICTDRWFHGHLHISEHSRKVFSQVNYSRARVIYGGVDTERFRPDPGVAKENTVLFVGRLLPHKGINYLIEAIPSDIDLQVIGQPYDAKYYALLKSIAKDKRVEFRHDCDDTALIRSYQKALCVVLPSVYQTVYGERTQIPELLGQTLLEGMACGLPAICTNVASMPEIVVDGVTGFVVPPNDPAALREKLIWLRDHPQEARRMGEAGRARVLERFTWPAVVQRCLDAYRDLAP